MSRQTTVSLLWVEGRIERWLRFGAPVEVTPDGPGRRRARFAPGAVFALVRWQGGLFGTTSSRLDILRATAPHEPFTRLRHVDPGADMLLSVTGWPKVEAALAAIAQVEAIGVRPEAACPDHWRHVHQRLAARLPPRAYRPARHAAWLLRREIAV